MLSQIAWCVASNQNISFTDEVSFVNNKKKSNEQKTISSKFSNLRSWFV